jgi:hypothetical protein
MKKTIQLEGKSARAKQVIAKHGKSWKVKERVEDWFHPVVGRDRTGLRVESIGCNCPSCMVAHEQHWMWIFEIEDREYNIK